MPVEKPLADLSFIDRPIWEVFDALALRMVLDESPSDTRTIGIDKDPFAFLDAVFPASGVKCTVTPLTDSLASHPAKLPVAFILPALLLGKEKTAAVLEACLVLPLVEIAVLPLADALSVW